MNNYSRELMHMTTSEKADYNRRYYQRNKQYWKDYYKTGHGIGRGLGTPGATAATVQPKKTPKNKEDVVLYNRTRLGVAQPTEYYNGLTKESVSNAWDRRRQRLNDERKFLSNERKSYDKKAKEAAKKGYWETKTSMPSKREGDWGFDVQDQSYKQRYTKGQYIDEKNSATEFHRTQQREKIAKEREDAKKQRDAVLKEVTDRIKQFKSSDLLDKDKRKVISQGYSIIRAMNKGYRKHMFSLFIDQIRTYGADPLN